MPIEEFQHALNVKLTHVLNGTYVRQQERKPLYMPVPQWCCGAFSIDLIKVRNTEDTGSIPIQRILEIFYRLYRALP